ncbi:MAG TPA: DUF3089 domain-containing protein [Gaiellaceae bacterium]|nr:DUF3089 domain-containing protein [Gaiellaceae bacterium]
MRALTRAATAVTAALLATAVACTATTAPAAGAAGAASRTVWLCAPPLAHDPCTSSLTATRVTATGATSVVTAKPAAASRFDCFYVYPTVSRERSSNADLRVQQAEIAVAVAQASRFSQVCRVYAPVYRQLTLAALAAHPNLVPPFAEAETAYTSLVAGFADYLAHRNDGRPIIFLGHSQGAAILIHLLEAQFDANRVLRRRLVLAILPGGGVEVRNGALTGGSFAHIPLCARRGEVGCVIAYSSFPAEPPPSALFGRVGQGVAAPAAGAALQVACVNPAALAGGAGALDSYFPSEGLLPTPWVEFPGLYDARCETAGGATWLQVSKATSASDARPTVSEPAGPRWGYHEYDVNLALGNLVSDVAAAEATWVRTYHG